jgi:hypothetical protein
MKGGFRFLGGEAQEQFRVIHRPLSIRELIAVAC